MQQFHDHDSILFRKGSLLQIITYIFNKLLNKNDYYIYDDIFKIIELRENTMSKKC